MSKFYVYFDGADFKHGETVGQGHCPIAPCDTAEQAEDLAQYLNRGLWSHRQAMLPDRQTALRIRDDASVRSGQIVELRMDGGGWLVLAAEGGRSLEIDIHDGEWAHEAAARFERLAGGRSALEFLRNGDLRGVR